MSKSQIIQLRELIKLRSCYNNYNIEKLSLVSSDKRFIFINSALEEMKLILLDKESTEISLNRMQSYIDTNYSMDWFFNRVSYEQNKVKDTTKLIRLMRYILETNSTIMAINLPISISIPGKNLSGIYFDQISGRVDLLLKQGTQFEAIKIKRSEPKYSYRARKDITIVENSIELICMMLGLSCKYPASNLKVSLYYLKNKNDKADNFLPFDDKKGNNIISTNFTSFISPEDSENKELLSHLVSVLSMSENEDCQNCINKSLCKYIGKFRYPNIPTNVEVSEKKEITYTKSQNEIIEHVDGPMNVIAVPGAGKTGSLVPRMKYLIDEKGINASNILFLTFTNKACEEIKTRVSKCMAPNAALPHIYTFNSLGYHILRENTSLIGKIRLADETDRLAIISSALSIAPAISGVSYDGMFTNYGLIRRCDSWFKEIDKVGEDCFRVSHTKLDVDGIIGAYRIYVERFKSAGYINYDEQIELCNELFRCHPKILSLYSKLYKYIMVDEFQDVDDNQVKFVYSLASAHRNIVVVGDDDQSIYAFRGGSNQHMLDFTKIFTRAKTVIMNDNFRSNDKILDASQSLISNNSNRFSKNFISHKSVNNPPIIVKNASKEKLLKYLDQISKKVKLGDVAIIARKNSTLVEIADYISPYYEVVSPKDYLIEDTVFLLLYDVMSLYYKNMKDDQAFYRISKLYGVSSYLHKQDRRDYLYDNLVKGEYMYPILLNDTSTLNRYHNVSELEMSPFVSMGYKLFLSFKAIQYSVDITSAIDEIYSIWNPNIENQDSPVLKLIKDDIEEKRLDSISELYKYMDYLLLFEDKTRVGYSVSDSAINLLTAHDSKGKEFPYVLIYGVEDFTDSCTAPEVVEEERRLLFVAMTRAENNLIIFSLDGPENKFVTEIKDRMMLVG